MDGRRQSLRMVILRIVTLFASATLRAFSLNDERQGVGFETIG